jgi:hypothetical protein
MKRILLSVLALICLLTNQKAFSQSSCALNPDFSDPNAAQIVDGSSPGGGYEVGDVFLFHDVLPAVNAEISIEAMQGVFIWSMENNSANPQRFQPFIASTSSGSEGYVQFAITFRKSSDNSIIPLTQLRITAFDVDGDVSPSYAISETISVAETSSITFNSPTTVTDAGTISDGGFNWRTVTGEAFQYTGTSNIANISDDPAHSFSAQYNPGSVFHFRLGYTTQQIISAALDYSIEFGCFVEAQNIPLPLTLLNFNGSYNNNKSILNWTTQSEVNVDRYELERSSDGNIFVKVGSVNAKGMNGETSDYQFTEDMVNTGGSLFYYRLKSVDKDGRFTYSKVVALRRDNKMFNEISIVPNPVLNGNGVIKINTSATGSADLKILDFSGRIIVLQKIKLFEGVNVLPIANIRQLPAGMYSVQLFKGGEVLNSKFVIGR